MSSLKFRHPSALEGVAAGLAELGAHDAPAWLPPGASPSTRHVLPSLFDRLCAQAPGVVQSVRGQRDRLRACVLRDLQALLNTANHEHLLDPLRHDAVRRSCWNYGAGPLAGVFVGGGTWQRIESAIRAAIERFEPRIDAASLRVMPLDDRAPTPRHNVLRFAIEGRIHDLPQAVAFSVHSTLDLETRHVHLSPTHGRPEGGLGPPGGQREARGGPSKSPTHGRPEGGMAEV